MLKKVTYLVLGLMIMLMTTVMAAAPAKEDTQWHPMDFGAYADGEYYFNKDTIRYGRLDNGDINPNIIIYQEKKVNNTIASVQYQFYSITDGKINIENKAIKLGDETFYTRKGKLRWVDKPQYEVWITVKPDTYGYMRYKEIVDYAQAHSQDLKDRS